MTTMDFESSPLHEVYGELKKLFTEEEIIELALLCAETDGAVDTIVARLKQCSEPKRRPLTLVEHDAGLDGRAVASSRSRVSRK
jgi:hypothetical protein